MISILISGVALGSASQAMAEVQDKNMDWMQEARNQEIPVEEKIPVRENPSEKESGIPVTENTQNQKIEIKSFDPFASDKPDVQSSPNQWQQIPAHKGPINNRTKLSVAIPEEKSVKTEEQASILSFNLMLNWLNRFKSNQDMF